MNILERFLTFVREEQLFTQEDRLLLAVSGGKDSVFMVEMFVQGGFQFGIAHCNFQLRGEESIRDATFVKNIAKSVNVPFFSKNFDTSFVAEKRKISIQMAARDLRYEWLEEIRGAEDYDYIGIAHHQTDVAETMLLNLVRGTGIAGLHGILSKRGKLIRPLLGFNGPEIAQFIQRGQIDFREDQSNTETKYSRNKIRLEVLPVLKKINPALEHTFYKASKRFLLMERFMNQHIATLREELLIEIATDVFQGSLTQLRTYADDPFVLYEVFKPFGFSETVIQDLMICLLEPTTGNRYYSDTHQLFIDREDVILREKISHPITPILIQKLPKDFTWGPNRYQVSFSTAVHVGEEIKKNHEGKKVMIDADNVLFPMEVRSWHVGDFFRPLGLRGRKKVSDFLIDQKIPLDQKKEVPLLINANREILSVGTRRIDDRYKISSATKKVIIFEKI